MDAYNGKIPIIVIAGPTASGKTETAIEVAETLGGEIVSADSMQIYKRLDVGTAKPTDGERARARHWLIDIKSPDEPYSVADYVSDAAAAIDDIVLRKKIPIICGGTGLYISSLVNGISFVGEKPDGGLREEIFAEYEKNGIQPFLDEFEEKDSEYARTLHPNNVKRILRAVERIRLTGVTDKKQNELSRKEPSRYEALCFVLCPKERSELYARIEKRIDRMTDGGLIEEAKTVFDNRETFKTAAQAIGYKELFPYFEGTAALEECVAALKQATRRYAKRQVTWFKREPNAVWLDSVGTDAAKMIAREYKNKYKE